MTWTYVEPCCGRASVAFAWLGATRSLLPYQGSKWRFRRALMDEARGLGLHGAPTVVRVSDVGPFGIASPTCLDTAGREAVIERLEALAARDPREVFEALQFACVPEDPASYTAELLFLQRLSFSGKAVGDRDGRWVSPGFNASSAYGLPATERFGRVSPMVPSLLRVLRGYRNLQAARIEGGREPAT